jgi:hypothetical protein
VAQPTRDTMALDGRSHGFGDDQPNPWTRAVLCSPPDVHDQIGLRRAHPVPHRGVKLR